MRTSLTGMAGAPERSKKEKRDVRAEAFVTDEAELVIYDPENPMAWISSMRYIEHVDAEEKAGAGD